MNTFDWDDANVGHIARHSVQREEAEQVIGNEPLDLYLETADEEDRITSIGRTNKGRFLAIVTTMRGALIRIITAFPAPERLIALYFIRKGESNQ